MEEKPATPEPVAAGGPPGEAREGVRKRSVKIAGHSTSLSLEAEFWDALKEVAAGRGLSINALIEEIDRGRRGNLSSAVRVYLLKHFRDRPAGEGVTTEGAAEDEVSPPAPSAGT